MKISMLNYKSLRIWPYLKIGYLRKQVKIRSLGWAQIQYGWSSYEKRKSGYRHTQKEDCLQTQREDGHLQAKERGREQILPSRPLEDIQIWSWPSSLQNCEKIGFYCWSQPACGVLLWHLTNKCHTITAIPANTCTGVVKCQALLPTWRTLTHSIFTASGGKITFIISMW